LANLSVAFLAFIIDSQHSMMFGHSLVLHAQEINLQPPCKEDIWGATTALEWQRAMQRHKGETELTLVEILKTFTLEPSTAKEKVSLDPFGSFIVLHGLISVKWHYQQKALGIGKSSV
jgi:Fungal specific transcription factor domain